LQTKESATDLTGKIVFGNFENDFVEIKDISNGIIEDNKFAIDGKNSFIEFEAYDSNGNLISGDWYMQINEDTGYYYLNNTGAIPEPSTLAAILGVLALSLAMRRRK